MAEPMEPAWFPRARAGPLQHLPVRVLFPVALAFAWYLGCLLFLPPGHAWIFGGLLLAYFIPPSGKESVIPLGIVLGIPWYLMAMSVVVLDVLAGLFMILNLDVAFRIPYLGPWIARFLAGGRDLLAGRPWLSRWGLPGLAFFVMLPFQGTGGTGAPLVGWMLGLGPGEILLAIAIGSTAEALIFALGSELIWSLATTYLTYGTAAILALAVIAVVVIAMYLLGRRKGQG
ncbi:MAG: small multi-drug export protein [Methanomicrobiales archaeon]|nr:small multi-drug export protein [Methanomicrobiales archaeon]